MWLRRVIPIALIFSFRMLGLFMLIPVFTIYALTLEHATPFLMGAALGAYGLTQGVLQIPFGMLSDRYGRKPLIAFGLGLLILGSLLGAYTDSIYGMIAARLLQGIGAIGSVLIALLADLTPASKRTGAMAVVGLSIGLSVSAAMVLSPIIAHYTGLKGIFLFTALLGIMGLLVLFTIVPTPQRAAQPEAHIAQQNLLTTVLCDKPLLYLDAGIFIQHFVLTATFFVIPMLLKQFVAQGHLSEQWHFYLPLMLGSFLGMVPLIAYAERAHRMRTVFLLSIALLMMAQLGMLVLSSKWISFCTLMFIYFVGFNVLEASLPSLVSKQATPHNKGTAMGVYSSSQFLGIFAGGFFAGIFYQHGGEKMLFASNAIICLMWLLVSLSHSHFQETRV